MNQSSLLKKAIEFSHAATVGNKRLSGEEYISHASRVKDLLEGIGISDENTLIAALLHDTPKFGLTNIEEIGSEFNEDIAYLVQKLNQVSNISIPDISNSFNPNFQQYLIQLSADIRVLIIRLADRLDNIQTSHELEDIKKQRIANKALSIYAPIAYSAGIYKFTRELQNEAFKILNPNEYETINKVIQNKFKELEDKINAMKKDIAEFLVDNNISNYELSSRTKSPFSIHQKILRKYKGEVTESTITNINDLVGIRVLLPTIEDCYKLLAHLQGKWKMVPEEYDDYIQNPKSNGYQTLQTAFIIQPDILCEVQIRTFEMHERNEFGGASHLQYKYGTKVNHNIWLKKLIGTSDGILSEQALQGFKKFFEDTIFVFTPKYDLITLPKGSTPIDFAYEIHSEIGDRCSGVEINGQFAKFDTLLKSGDIITIQTSKSSKPSQKWLEFIKTPEAKKHIRKWQH